MNNNFTYESLYHVLISLNYVNVTIINRGRGGEGKMRECNKRCGFNKQLVIGKKK